MRYRFLSLVLLPLLGACTQESPRPERAALDDAPSAAAAVSVREQAVADPSDPVAVAMSAAPPAIGQGATIMRLNDSGEMVELRAGTNGWICLPDENPAAPGSAPMCIDGYWQEWMGAFMAGETPDIDGIGTSYMLQGGAFASNSDPFAKAPPAGAEWLHDGPHLMIVVPDLAMLEGYPTEHSVGGPYVMWAGTPYAHLMVPVSGM
ncbi:MAG: hypothetical protein RQ751_09610 [Longimicrobiales bacterium]|nr:hypothetical protein [Longimicrobiales bacterium]